MIRLYTSFYPERDPTRAEELLECLRRNLGCSSIDQVCLLLEQIDEPPIDHDKLDCRKTDHRPTYHEFFQWCHENVQSDEDISIVTNSDIYFDEDLNRLTRSIRPDQCFALARWNVDGSGRASLFDRNDSQDSWIFRGKIRSMDSDFCVGIPRCDNRIMHELRQAGYDVLNPAFSIRSFHLHAGQREDYAEGKLPQSVAPPYGYLWPHNLMSLPASIVYSVRNPTSQLRWKLDIRRIGQSLPIRAIRRLSSPIKRIGLKRSGANE